MEIAWCEECGVSFVLVNRFDSRICNVCLGVEEEDAQWWVDNCEVIKE